MRRDSRLAMAAAVFSLAACLLSVAPAQEKAPNPAGYHVVKIIHIGGPGRWDYCVLDSATRRLYVSHGTHVVVLNADTGKMEGNIPNTLGVHGIALAPDLGRGFISDGRADTVTIFDLKTLKPLGTVKSGGRNPDAIYYEPKSKRVFAFNGRSGTAVAIDGAKGTVAGMIPLGGKPEFAVGDGEGHVFDNIEDKGELVEIDASQLKVVHRWSLAPCKEPSGLAIDTRSRRLFSVCGNNLMMVVNADTGKIVASPAIGEDPDAAAFDPGTQLAFSSNGESGTLTVIHEDGPDQYSVVGNLPTRKYARTMAVDLKTHDIFLPIAEFEPVAPKGDEEEPPMKPNSFGVILVAK
jgi:DNA-binding beta-propeller fold protein YncE